MATFADESETGRNAAVQPRRQVLAGLSAMALVNGLSARAWTDKATRERSSLSLGVAATQAIPADYVGLSYESAQLANTDFFAADNRELVHLFRQLAPRGVLRIGGNSSEFCWWKPTESAREPQMPVRSAATYMPHRLTAIGPKALDRLAGFLDATGWRLIYGLNLGGLSLGAATPQSGAEEAAYVSRVMGSRLMFFQIGNEPDFYGNANTGLRGAGWNFDRYLEEWTRYAQAVAERVPEARFGGPDVGSNVDWALRFAAEAPKRLPGRIVACTSHYYAEGPPDSPQTAMERLLVPDERLEQRIEALNKAAARAHLDYRMTAGTSWYPARCACAAACVDSALWAMKFMLELATLGTAGVNFHGGGSSQIRSALGDHLPGATIAGGASGRSSADGRTAREMAANALGSFYTPIAGSRTTGFVARPIFYGMKLAGLLAGGAMRSVTNDVGMAAESVWAAKMPDGATRVVAINAGEGSERYLRIPARGPARIWRLQAATLAATSGVLLAGAAIDAEKSWRPRDEQRVANHGGQIEIRMPGASAAVIFLDSADR